MIRFLANRNCQIVHCSPAYCNKVKTLHIFYLYLSRIIAVKQPEKMKIDYLCNLVWNEKRQIFSIFLFPMLNHLNIYH